MSRTSEVDKLADKLQYSPRYSQDQWVRIQAMAYAVEMHKTTSSMDVVAQARKIESYLKGEDNGRS